MERLIKDADDQSVVLSSTSPGSCVTSHTTNALVKKTASTLHVAILTALVKKNGSLLRRIFGRSTLTTFGIIRNIATEAWETSLQPLEYWEIELLWHKLEKRKQVEGDLCYYLLDLTDRCWLTLSGIRDSKPERLYPSSLSSLGVFIMSRDNAEAISIQILGHLRNAPENVLNVLSNPQLFGRTVPAVVATKVLSAGLCNIL